MHQHCGTAGPDQPWGILIAVIPHQEVRLKSPSFLPAGPLYSPPPPPPLTSLSSLSHSPESAQVGGLFPGWAMTAPRTDSSTLNYPWAPWRANEEWARRAHRHVATFPRSSAVDWTLKKASEKFPSAPFQKHWLKHLVLFDEFANIFQQVNIEATRVFHHTNWSLPGPSSAWVLWRPELCNASWMFCYQNTRK